MAHHRRCAAAQAGEGPLQNPKPRFVNPEPWNWPPAPCFFSLPRCPPHPAARAHGPSICLRGVGLALCPVLSPLNLSQPRTLLCGARGQAGRHPNPLNPGPILSWAPLLPCSFQMLAQPRIWCPGARPVRYQSAGPMRVQTWSQHAAARCLPQHATSQALVSILSAPKPRPVPGPIGPSQACALIPQP